LSFAGVESMGDGTRDQGEHGSRPADDAALSARLQRLGERLDHVGASRPTRTDPAPRPSADSSAMARGLRLSSEFVIGVLVGAVLGWFLDRMLGITPWGLIAFVLLGFVASVLNLVRAVGAGTTGAPDGRTEN
jgi:ATP synthase protein I